MPKKLMTAAEAYNRAAGKCAVGEQCSSDIFDKLLSWGISEPDAAAIVQRLIEEHFIDDTRFAGAFARDKARYQGWGLRKIAWQLKQKGIDPNVIDDALATIDTEEYNRILRELLCRKYREVSRREPQARRAAMMRFAASRGFDLSLASRFISEIHGNTDSDDENFD